VITPDEIKQRAERQYLPTLQDWLRGEAFSTLIFPVGKLSFEYAKLRAEVQLLQASARESIGYGYQVEFQLQQKRSLGMQTLPTRVVIGTLEDLLALVGKTQEFAYFQQDVSLIRLQIPFLEAWLVHNPRKVLAQHGSWPELLAVCHYFLEYPQPQLYMRELPISVHTKFIEQHSGILRELLEALLPAELIHQNATSFQQRFHLREDEPLLRIRFLDDQFQKRYSCPLDDLSLPISQAARLNFADQRCLITENKLTFLTLPALPDTIALLGGGFQVGMLGLVPWLSQTRIHYWGDLDAQGFQILSQLRSLFPHTQSLMMDEATLNSFASFCVTGTPCPVQKLPYLTDEEQSLFAKLAAGTIRLEQERISQVYVLQQIEQCL
jgi:hypothetical protein